MGEETLAISYTRSDKKCRNPCSWNKPGLPSSYGRYQNQFFSQGWRLSESNGIDVQSRCTEIFGWHMKQREVVEEYLLWEAFQRPMKGVDLIGLIRVCLDFWIEARLLCNDAFAILESPSKWWHIVFCIRHLVRSSAYKFKGSIFYCDHCVVPERRAGSNCHPSWTFSQSNWYWTRCPFLCVEMRCLLVTGYVPVYLNLEINKSEFIFPALKLTFSKHFFIGNTCFKK